MMYLFVSSENINDKIIVLSKTDITAEIAAKRYFSKADIKGKPVLIREVFGSVDDVYKDTEVYNVNDINK